MVRYARVGLPGLDVLVGQNAERLGPSSRMYLRVGYIGLTAYLAVYGRRKHTPMSGSTDHGMSIRRDQVQRRVSGLKG